MEISKSILYYKMQKYIYGTSYGSNAVSVKARLDMDKIPANLSRISSSRAYPSSWKKSMGSVFG